MTAFLINLGVLGFLSRMVDLAQQPSFVYQVFGAVYAAAGALLGLYQMGSYRKPNQWLNLLHRPMHRLRIAGALTSASALLLLLAVALPIAIVALYQQGLTARVVDHRHWLIPLAAWLIALSCYLAGAYAMVGNRRHSFAAFLLPNLFLYAQASGVAMLGVQLVVIGFLALLLGIAFKPDPAAPARNPGAVLAVALPVQLGAYVLAWMLGFGVELLWTVTGTHPLNMPKPPAGGTIEADRAEGKDMLLLGIAGSRDPDAALWREQIALSDVYTRYPLRTLPHQGDMTNPQPMEWVDGDHNTNWVYSHDRGRFIGYGLLDKRARGELGIGATQAAFPAPTLAFGAIYLYNANAVYQFDSEQQRVFERIRLPQGEVMASPPGPHIGAFFDLDGTLVAGFTGVILTQEQFLARQMGIGDFIAMIQAGLNHQLGRAEFEDLIERQVVEVSVVARDPLQVRVVKGDEVTVRGGVHVGLEIGETKFHGVGECAHRVLDPEIGGEQRSTAMRHRDELRVKVVPVNHCHVRRVY